MNKHEISRKEREMLELLRLQYVSSKMKIKKNIQRSLTRLANSWGISIEMYVVQTGISVKTPRSPEMSNTTCHYTALREGV